MYEEAGKVCGLPARLEFEWNRGQLEAAFGRGSLSQADSEPFQVRD
jgi:hypothetical protein